MGWFREEGQRDNIALLGWLHNLGATEEARALTVEEISARIGMEPISVREDLKKLILMGYVEAKDEERFFLKPPGILRVVKTYT